MLAGCAAQTAFQAGNELLRQGKTADGLAKLEEATRLEPGSAEFRIAYIQARERETQSLLARGDQSIGQGAFDAAEQFYRQALVLRPGNDRALAGLRAIENRRRWDEWMKAAQTAVAKKDWDTARAKLRALLTESPQHAPAVRLLQRIEELTAKPTPETALSAAYRKSISIEFKEAPLKTVFEVIARSSGLNFLFDKEVKTDQKTSIYLRNSTIEAAVNLTLITNQLEQRVLDANTVLVYPNTQAKLKEYQPLTVKSFYLANADAKVVANTLKTLLKTRDVVVDEKLNLLILRDSPEAIRLAEKLVALHDVPDAEVMLEVEILEVKRTRLLDLGVRWPEQLSLAPIASGTAGVLTLNELRNLNSSTTSATIGPLVINAKKTDTDANILANPRIRVRNREKAKILIGDRVPNITTTSTSTGFVAESVTYVDVGLKLDVEPTIYLDDEVSIKISLEVSNIISQLQTKSGTLAYQIGTRTATTVLRLRDGENQVLAGLINDEDRRTGNKVPALGDLPVVGRLFGSQSDDGTKTEIVLSITPRIVRNVQRLEAAAMEFESGTESSLRTRVGDVGGQPAAAEPGASAPARAAARGVDAPPPAARPAAPTTTTDSTSGDANAAAIPSLTQLRWQGPAQLRAGDVFALQLVMQSDRPIVGVPMSIDFDPAVVQLASVTEGEFLKQGTASTSFNSQIDPGGHVTIAAARSGTAASSGATGVGVVTTLNFRVVSAVQPQTTIQLSTVAPTGPGAQQIGAVLPAPHTLSIRP